MEILYLTRNLPPLLGGMERMMLHTVTGMSANNELTVVGPSGCRDSLPPGVKVYELNPHPAVFLPGSLVLGLWLGWRRKPEWIIGGSGLLGPVLLLLQTLLRSPGLIFLYGLDIVVDNGIYQRFFTPTFKHIHRVIAISRHTASLAAAAGVRPERMSLLNPGTELREVDKPTARKEVLDRSDINPGNLLLFVGRVTPRKGLRGFVEHCLPGLLETCPDTVLLVVGDHPGQGLTTRSSELDAVVRIVEERGMEHAVKFLGKVNDELLTHSYAAADVLLFPLVETVGDVEGFGLVAIEAAACGTPTVAFAVGGVTDAISEGVSGHLVAPGDYDAFRESVISVLNAPRRPQLAIDFAEGFAWEHYHKRLQDILVANVSGAAPHLSEG